MDKVRYFISRLGSALIAVWGIVTIVFFVLRVVPGDPAMLMLGPDAQPEQLQALRQEMGLNAPLVTQYVDYIWGLLKLDFGRSIEYGDDAFHLVVQRLPATGLLAITSIVLAYAWGLPIGILTARRAGRAVDHFLSSGMLIAISVPGFWIGIMLILIFSSTLRMLPSGGAGTIFHLILPSVTLSLAIGAVIARLARGTLLEIMSRDYIEAARARGLSEERVVLVHALVNILVPITTVFGLQLGALLGGTVVIETVFSWPGVGRLLINAILNRDYPVVQAAVIVIATIFVLVNFLVDMSYSYLDPRIKLQDI
jgi:ABC-type dipeptide/oligopeptide/nickel transport system permease component